MQCARPPAATGRRARGGAGSMRMAAAAAAG